MSKLKLCLVLSGICLFLMGCQQEKLVTEYGKISGIDGATSLNGVSVFADMFAERGFSVKRRQKISPRIERFDTLVWFPDDYSCPSVETTEALNNWLENGWERTLIYVGRDYTAQADYLRKVMGSAPSEQKEELLRRMAEAKLAEDTGPKSYDYYWLDDDLTSCDWFEHQSNRRVKAAKLTGPLTTGIDTTGPPLEYATQLVPNPETSGPDGTWEVTTWLSANDCDFVFELQNRFDEYSDNKILVVNNGSFLLNYALVDRRNRQFAGELIDSCNEYGDVLFLESGPHGIEVSDSDTVNHNTWAWIAQPPLRYIVPHILLWGVLFCFVYFPIFGRPRTMRKRSTSTFRNHVDAIGKLLGRSGQTNRAINKIQKYQQLVHNESNRNRDNH